MSNPVKNAEIEDVLSSIRRLVSENHSVGAAREAVETPTINAGPTRAESTPRPKAADRLVLSPVMRIEEPQIEQTDAQSVVAESPIELTSPVDDTPFVNSLKEDLVPLRENLPSFLQERVMQKSAEPDDLPEAEAEPADTQSPTAFASTRDLTAGLAVRDAAADTAELAREHLSEVGNTLPFPTPEDLTFETARKDTHEEALPVQDSPVAHADDVAHVAADDARPWEIEGERLSEWHSSRSPSADETAALDFEPDGPEDGDNAGIPVASLNWEDHEAELSTPVEPLPEANAHPVTEPTPEPALELASELKVAPQPEAHVADPVAQHVSEAVIEDIAATDDTIEAQQYEAVLDEEMLRDLVGEIVRQELQGPLGERITRNVRKLVRREINRALTARSFNDG